jgi:hypothetical protein
MFQKRLGYSMKKRKKKKKERKKEKTKERGQMSYSK